MRACVRACVCVCVCVCVLHLQGTPSQCIQSRIAQQLKYVNRNVLSMFKAMNKCFKQKCAVLLLYQVEGRPKSLKIQH